MNFRSSSIRYLSFALMLTFAYAVAAAQPQPDSPAELLSDTATPPAPSNSAPVRAARLTFIAGEVRIQRSDNTGEDTAALNMPLAEGTRILTGDYGQAEVEFEDGSVARLTPRSAVSISVLALDLSHVAHTELSVTGGLAYFELRRSAGYTWLVEAGGTRVSPRENLTLRLNLDEPSSAFAVLTGSAHLERPDAFKADLNAGETLRPDAKDNNRYFLTPQLETETWDAWNESRDGAAADAADRTTAARNDFAGDQGYGWSDLDSSGNWYNVPGTGEVWQPSNADEGFDPYGYGAWVWGNGAYLWASGYSWGWTPYRCGSWQYFSSFGWGWTPNISCGRGGFAGGGYLGETARTGIFLRGPYPPRHNPVVRPLPRPGQPHPVVPVRGPDGPRPWTPHPGPAKIAGTVATPLPSLGSGFARGGNVLGKTLALDYPVDRKTHQPIRGDDSTPITYVNAGSSPVRLAPGLRTSAPSWLPPSRPTTISKPVATPAPAPRPLSPLIIRSPAAGSSSVTRPIPSVPTPPRPASPPPAPAPIRATPPSAAPAPSRPKL